MRLPRAVGLVEKVTVSEVAVEAVTLPTAPSLKATVLLEAVAEKLAPVMVRVGELRARPAVLMFTIGAATMVATCTALLDPP